MDVDVDGDEALIRVFRGAARAVDTAMRAQVNKVADEVTRKAQSMVPRHTGALAQSIRAEQVGLLEAVTGPVKKAGGWYGHMIEHGTIRVGPRPYMGPAADAAEKRLLRAAGQTVEKLL